MLDITRGRARAGTAVSWAGTGAPPDEPVEGALVMGSAVGRVIPGGRAVGWLVSDNVG